MPTSSNCQGQQEEALLRQPASEDTRPIEVGETDRDIHKMMMVLQAKQPIGGFQIWDLQNIAQLQWFRSWGHLTFVSVLSFETLSNSSKRVNRMNCILLKLKSKSLKIQAHLPGPDMVCLALLGVPCRAAGTFPWGFRWRKQRSGPTGWGARQVATEAGECHGVPWQISQVTLTLRQWNVASMVYVKLREGMNLCSEIHIHIWLIWPWIKSWHVKIFGWTRVWWNQGPFWKRRWETNGLVLRFRGNPYIRWQFIIFPV